MKLASSIGLCMAITLANTGVISADKKGSQLRQFAREIKGPNSHEAFMALAKAMYKSPLVFSNLEADALSRSIYPFLRHNDSYTQRAAVKVLGQLGRPESADKLIALLPGTGYLSQDLVLAVLQTMTTKSHASALFAALEIEGQRSAVNIYRRYIGRPGLAPLLIPALSSHSPTLRKATAELLERLADPIAGDALVRAIQREDDYRVANAIANALTTCADKKHLPALLRLLNTKGMRGLTPLARAFLLVDRSNEYRASRPVIDAGRNTAMLLLDASSSKNTPGVAVLSQWASRSKNSKIRERAASGLGLAPSTPGTIGTLCQLLRDKNDSVRTIAYDAIRQHHRVGAARCLMGSLQVRKHQDKVFRSLERLSGEKFGSNSRLWQEWLKQVSSTSIPVLSVALQTGTPERQIIAAHSIAQLPKKQIQQLMGILKLSFSSARKTKVKIAILQAIVSANTRESQTIVNEGFQDGYQPIDLFLARARAMEKLGDRTAREHVRKRLIKDKGRNAYHLATALWEFTGIYNSSALYWSAKSL